MQIEPIQLNGKTISECFMQSGNSVLILRFTDNTEARITLTVLEDGITYKDYTTAGLSIIKPF